MTDKLNDAELAGIQGRYNRNSDHEAVGDRAKLLDHIDWLTALHATETETVNALSERISTLNGELEAIKGRLVLRDIMPLIDKAVNGRSADKPMRDAAKAIIKYVLNGGE